jgi:hypothetical protein
MAEHTAQPGFGQRLPGRRADQHHETLRRRQPSRTLGAEIRRQLDEERPVDRHYPFPAALADHPNPAQCHVDVGQQQPSHLAGPQPTQQHQHRDRPVPMGQQIGQERADLVAVQGLGQPARTADQPPTGPRPSRTQMPQHTAGLDPQP